MTRELMGREPGVNGREPGVKVEGTGRKERRKSGSRKKFWVGRWEIRGEGPGI